MADEISVSEAAHQFLALCERQGVKARLRLIYPKVRPSTAPYEITAATLVTRPQKPPARKKGR